jgi:predicted secreted protein
VWSARVRKHQKTWNVKPKQVNKSIPEILPDDIAEIEPPIRQSDESPDVSIQSERKVGEGPSPVTTSRREILDQAEEKRPATDSLQQYGTDRSTDVLVDTPTRIENISPMISHATGPELGKEA